MIPSPDIAAKMDKVVALSAAMVRAQKALDEAPREEKAAAALSLQQLKNQRRELMGLLPKPRLVWSKP